MSSTGVATLKDSTMARFTQCFTHGDHIKIMPLFTEAPPSKKKAIGSIIINACVVWVAPSDYVLEHLHDCEACRGQGWMVEEYTKAVHGCDGSDEMCNRVCPVPELEQEQVGCNMCCGSGYAETGEIEIVPEQEFNKRWKINEAK